MADPFSTAAAAIGLVDVCVRTTRFIIEARARYREIDQELEEICAELQSLKTIIEAIANAYKGFTINSATSQHQRDLDEHWKLTKSILENCRKNVVQFEDLLKSTLSVNSKHHAKTDQIRKWWKLQSKDKDFVDLRQKITSQQQALGLMLDVSNLRLAQVSNEATSDSISGLSRSLEAMSQTLNSKLELLQNQHNVAADSALASAVQVAQKLASEPYINEHFSIPQSVSGSFTGREREFSILKEHLVPSSTERKASMQKRFVLYGLAGSGKTQTCCKFASDNRNSFWGIFWLNASSKEHLKQSFIALSRIPRVAENAAAVKSWLSSLGSARPWLLIIDNADDSNMLVEESFPDSVHGSILITTRNHSLRTQGTVGPRYIQFSGLNEAVSVNLLLRLADVEFPWTDEVLGLAGKIAKAVGYLPLALTYAGNTIASRLCTLQTYLDFFDRCWMQLRQRRNSQTISSVPQVKVAIYQCYELMLERLADKGTQASADALELLKIFAFLDHQNIKLEIFTNAANNTTLEAMFSKQEDVWHGGPKPPTSWSRFSRNLLIELVRRLSHLGSRPILPNFLAANNSAAPFDEFRLREAINELLKLSLILMSSPKEDTYTIHAAVHFWARQRPDMSLADQAIWCAITSNILSQAILLPPLGDTAEAEAFRRDLLPHVSHVQKMEDEIEAKFASNRKNRQRLFPVPQAPMHSERLNRLIKFSMVYYQGHQLLNAERLQKQVLDFLLKTLGDESVHTIGVLRLLSRTYFQLARMDEAVELQERAYKASLATLGQKHPETLQVMDQYGSALWLQGRFQDSRAMHTSAVEYLTEVFGEQDIITLKAMGGLGRALCKDFAFDEAIAINTRALNGLKTKLEPTHSAILEAMDNLAMSYFDRTAFLQGKAGDLERALNLEQQVFDKRVQHFGKEHYHTLWAGLNLARIRAIRGEVDEALAIFLPGRAVVQRDLEPDHFLLLFTELHHARILMCARKHEQAEQILTQVMAAYKRTKRRHPDRLLAIFSLIKCRRVLNKTEGTEELYQQLLTGVTETWGQGHPAVKTLLDERALAADTPDAFGGHIQVMIDDTAMTQQSLETATQGGMSAA